MTDEVDILIVDDDAALMGMLAMFFSEQGLRVVTTGRGTEAPAMVRRHHPRVVLLDIVMPGIDGLTICHAIKTDPDLRNARVLVMSSKDFEVERSRAKAMGAEAFLAKPVSPDAVLKQIKAMLAEVLSVRMWGTRGSIPTPGPETLRYGGNTSCVAVRLSTGRLLIFDAGSGIKQLGRALMQQGRPVEADIFLTHFHWDHIQGLPFFAPAYRMGTRLRIYGCEYADVKLHQIIANQMESVYFPVPLPTLAAEMRFQSVTEDRYVFDDFELETLYLHHPGTTIGYRLRRGGKTFAYVTDNELGIIEGEPSLEVRRVVDFVRGADLLIHDTQFTRAQYPVVRGWGHSCYEDVVRLGELAEVKRLAFFHHDPDRTDDEIDALVAAQRRYFAEAGKAIECFAAQEGMEIEL